MRSKREIRKRPTSWQRRRRRLLFLVAIPVTVLAVWIYWRIGLRREIDVQWAAFEAAGYPTTLDGVLDAYTAAGEEESEVVALNEALKLLLDEKKFNRQWRAAQEAPYSVAAIEEEYERRQTLEQGLYGDWDEATTQLVREYLDANAEAMSAVERALDKPVFRYDIDPSSVPYHFWQFEHWWTLRIAAGIFLVQGEFQLREDDIEGASDTVRMLFRIGEVLRDEPLYLAQVNRRRCHEVANASLINLLNHGQLADDELKRLQEVVARVPCLECWTGALAGNAVAAVDWTRNQTGNALFMSTALIGFHDRDVARFLKRIGDFNEIADVPWRLKTEEQREFGLVEGSFGPWRNFVSPLSSLHFRTFHGVSASIAQDETRSATAMIALAIERYRLANDRLPETLDELAPRFIDDLPVNPYTGASYAYNVLSPGYSVGSMPPVPRQTAAISSDGVFAVSR